MFLRHAVRLHTAAEPGLSSRGSPAHGTCPNSDMRLWKLSVERLTHGGVRHHSGALAQALGARPTRPGQAGEKAGELFILKASAVVRAPPPRTPTHKLGAAAGCSGHPREHGTRQK